MELPCFLELESKQPQKSSNFKESQWFKESPASKRSEMKTRRRSKTHCWPLRSLMSILSKTLPKSHSSRLTIIKRLRRKPSSLKRKTKKVKSLLRRSQWFNSLEILITSSLWCRSSRMRLRTRSLSKNYNIRELKTCIFSTKFPRILKHKTVSLTRCNNHSKTRYRGRMLESTNS